MQFSQTPSRRELLRSMSQGFHRTESASTWWGLFWLLVGIGVFVLILFALLAWQNRDKRPQPNNVGKLFSELAKRLGLNRAEQRVLKSVATHSDLSPAAQVFMSPGIFDSAVRRWNRSGTAAGEDEKARLTRLRGLIFGSVKPPDDRDAEKAPATG